MRSYWLTTSRFAGRIVMLGLLAIMTQGLSAAAASVIRVPSEFVTIQEAVEAAAEGDTVLVAPGTYTRTWIRSLPEPTGNLEFVANVFIERPIVLASEAGAAATVLRGSRQGPVIVVSEARGVVIEGFTVTNGKIDELVLDGGGGIFCELSDVEIRHNIIEGNSAPYGGGILCSTASSAWIHENVIRDNSDCEFGGGVAMLVGSNATVEFNVISGNNADIYGGAILVNEQSLAIIQSNTIADNHATSGSAIFCRDGSEVDASRNIFAFGTGGPAVFCDTLAMGRPCTIALSCNDFWDNAGEDTKGCEWGELNRSSDPFFCSPDLNDFTLCAFSPSLGVEDACGTRGALPSGCYDCPVAERRLSWGFLKALYR